MYRYIRQSFNNSLIKKGIKLQTKECEVAGEKDTLMMHIQFIKRQIRGILPAGKILTGTEEF